MIESIFLSAWLLSGANSWIPRVDIPACPSQPCGEIVYRGRRRSVSPAPLPDEPRRRAVSPATLRLRPPASGIPARYLASSDLVVETSGTHSDEVTKGLFPVYVWKLYKQQFAVAYVTCLADTFWVPDMPDQKITYFIPLEKFAPDDFIVLEHSPAFSVNLGNTEQWGASGDASPPRSVSVYRTLGACR